MNSETHIKNFCLKKYPTRFKHGIRTINELSTGHVEIYSNGGEVLYLSKKKANEIRNSASSKNL